MNLPQTIHDILDLARWAPSGDNTQVWRFEVLGPDHVAVHFHDTREDTVYDFRGRPSQLSHGTLLETMTIAATAHGLRTEIARRPDDHAAPTLLQCLGEPPQRRRIAVKEIERCNTRVDQRMRDCHTSASCPDDERRLAANPVATTRQAFDEALTVEHRARPGTVGFAP